MDTSVCVDDITWTDPTCPVARLLDLLGDRWSLLIVRDAMDNARSFTDFQRRTGIARNVLADRLRSLVARGILVQETAASGRRQIYVLTEAGRDLFTVIVAMRQWGERHTFADDEPRSSLVDASGRPVARLRPVDCAGHPVDVHSSTVVRGDIVDAGTGD